MNIWRLNVRETQIEECIRNRRFAFDTRPRNPEIHRGDVLLLQLVLADAKKFGKESNRIEFVLIFDHYEEDHDGTASAYYWPRAGKTWRWILFCSDVVPTIPFSLEKLSVSANYFGQTNPVRILEKDVSKIIPYLLRYAARPIEEIGKKIHNIVVHDAAAESKLWALLRNNDRIVEDFPDQVEWVTVIERKEIRRNPELPIALKELYDYKCQVCKEDFKGKPYSETHHVIWLSRGGVDHSNNLIVVCPNHHRIIHETKPDFDRHNLAFVYPNGFQEHLKLKDHLKDPGLLQKIIEWSSKRNKVIGKEKT
ncbi:MAG: HNH endonuclease signature motif containing protein [Candidatus Ratteibacteria bacterium]|jgi:5-methylcytosine-specific restriction endonuclease McrA